MPSLLNLIETLRLAAKSHYLATLEGNFRLANKNADLEEKSFKAILEFGNQGRDALLELTDDDDKAVALAAAVYSLNYSPSRCEKVINTVAKDPELIGFIAQQALKRRAEGNLNFE